MIHVVQLATVTYADGLALQRRLVELRKAGEIGDVLLLLGHTPVITLGRNAKVANLLASPEQLAARNAERRADHESGGQKQSSESTLDEDILAAARTRLGIAGGDVCHPSLLFGLFRHVWHGNLPMDFFWRRTRWGWVRSGSVKS